MKPLHHFTGKLIFISTLLCACMSVQAVYTLTDADVEVVDGEITSCSYDFSDTDIIIPATLDGETITGIADIGFPSVFESNGITSVVLPYTITSIGKLAFRFNAIVDLDLSACANLVTIGDGAFYDNDITALNLSSCSQLTTIGNQAFYNNKISSLDLSTCAYLTTIGYDAFWDNELTNLDLSNCTELQTISKGAFFLNNLSTLNISCANLNYIGESSFSGGSLSMLDLSACVALQYIGEWAFSGNSLSTVNVDNCASLISIGKAAFVNNAITAIDLSDCISLSSIGGSAFEMNIITSFNLPINSEYEADGWKDEYNMEYGGGDLVTNLDAFYYVPTPYTLTDSDVEIVGGVIQSCLYDFSLKNIVIPETLDDQSVTGIADKEYGEGVFQEKGIRFIELPASLVKIGNYAFYKNDLTILNLSTCPLLDSIGEYAFESNSIRVVDFSASSSLKIIGRNAFSSNTIEALDLDSCISLQTIERRAFGFNSFESLNLNACIALSTIGDLAFRYNYNLDTVIINGCPSLTYIGAQAFNDCATESFILPTPTKPDSMFVEWIDGNSNHLAGGIIADDVETEYRATFVYASYTVQFTVTNDSGTPVPGAVTILTGYGSSTSNSGGIATFNNVTPQTDIPYTVAAGDEHWPADGTVTVSSGNVNVPITLDRIRYNVTFTVSDGTNPVEGATISLDSYDNQITNASGEAAINGVLPATNMGYSVTATGYNDMSGSVSVSNDNVTEVVTLTAVTNSLSSYVDYELKVYPNPAINYVVIELNQLASFMLIDESGRILIRKNLIKGSNQISLNNYSPGIYLVYLKSENTIQTFKITKQNK